MVVAACVILIPACFIAVGMVASIAVPAFIHSRQHAQEEHARILEQAGLRLDANGEVWKDSSQSYPLNADGRFSLSHLQGRVEIHGWTSNAVVVTAAKKEKGSVLDIVISAPRYFIACRRRYNKWCT